MAFTEVTSPVTSSYENSTSAETITGCNDRYSIIDLVLLSSAVAAIFGLSFLVRRNKFCLDCCDRRPGILQPLNFVDDFSRRWSFAVCYIAMALSIVNVYNAMQKTKFSGDSLTDLQLSWQNVGILLLQMTIICVLFYPLFACLTYSNCIPANIVGFFYAIFITVRESLYLDCVLDTEEEPGPAMWLILLLPALIALSVLVLTYGYDLGSNLYRYYQSIQDSGSDKQRVVADDGGADVSKGDVSVYFDYVRALLRRSQQPEDLAAPQPLPLHDRFKRYFNGVVRYFTYEPVIGFRYPLRLICTLTVCVLVVCWAVIMDQVISGKLFSYPLCSMFCENIENLLTGDDSLNCSELCDEVYKNVEDTLNIQQVVWTVSGVLAAFVQLICIAHMLVTYKQRLLKYFRGGHKLHKKLQAEPSSVLIGGMRYSGYQIVASLLGYVVSTVMFFFCVNIFAYLIIIPIRDGTPTWLLQKLISLWPMFTVSFVIYVAQIAACKYYFLHDEGRTLAFRHRKIFHVVEYFLFIFNITLGFLDCLKRLFVALLAGTVLISRLDYVFLVKGYERYDSVHLAYMSMVVLDVCHNHPVMRAFVELLQQMRASRRQKIMARSEIGYQAWQNIDMADVNSSNFDSLDEEAMPYEIVLKKKRLRNRWHKLRTLINNPSLTIKERPSEQNLLRDTQYQPDEDNKYKFRAPSSGELTVGDDQPATLPHWDLNDVELADLSAIRLD